ncbi:MAG: pyridoxal 5'-phosphate synthase glutaminase subunit PdxT [Chloroflexota bacterium]
MKENPPRIGVLALQGSFAEHVTSLRRADAEAFELRMPEQLDGLEGLVIPGGESTTILKLMNLYRLREPLRERIGAGLPVLGTCAGAVCLSTHISSHAMHPLGLIDIVVERNAFGRQVESFEEDLQIDELEGPPFRGVFIRAPVIKSCGPNARVLARLANGTIVACAQENVLVTSFHPEFVDDLRVHRYFTAMVESRRTGKTADGPVQAFSRK